MSQPLHEILDELLRKAASTVEGRETLMRYNHTLNFEVLNGDSFHVEIIDGEADVQTGASPPKPLADAHNIKGNEEVFRTWFAGEARFSDLIHDHRIYPQAAHTTKRHIDSWIVKLVRLGQDKPSLRDEY